MKEIKFSALTNLGNNVNQDTFLENKVILFFYPKDMTPGCTKEVCDFRDVFSEITSFGYKIYGVSKDNVDSHKKFVAKYNLPFELIADDSGDLCRAFGVWQEKSMFGKKYMGIERSTFILNEKSEVIKHWAKVSVSNHIKEVIEWIKAN